MKIIIRNSGNAQKLKSCKYLAERDQVPTNYRRIYAGIAIDDNNNIKFNWDNDLDEDIIVLANDISGQFVKDRVNYIYGYEYSKNASASEKKLIRDYLKSLGYSATATDENVQEFVERGVLRIEKYVNLNEFGATIHIESSKSPSLVDLISQYISEYIESIHTDFSLVKKTYEDVEFDKNKAYNALLASNYTPEQADREITFTVEKFESLKKSGELFQIKRFIPKPIRSGFLNFLKFKNEYERKLYESLQGVNVLIFDDFLTSGSTISELVRYLRSIHDENTLTAFVLIKQ